MEKSVSLDRVFMEAPFYERFARAAAAGFSHVELGVWTELDLGRVSDEMNRHGLSLSALAGSNGHDLSCSDTQGDFMEFVSQSLAVAKSFGCKGVVLESNASSAHESASGEDSTIIAREDLRNAAIATRVLMAIAQKAQRGGISLYLKPAGNFAAGNGFLSALRLTGNVVAAVNSPALRLLLDSTELWIHRDDPTAASIMRRIHALLGYVHIGGRSKPEEWREELTWFRRNVVSFYGYAGMAGLCYPAAAGDGAILDEFRSL